MRYTKSDRTLAYRQRTNSVIQLLIARHNKGTFVLRIEDTDTKRNIADGERSQMENLHWLGIDWDEGPDKPGEYGPYRQSERKGIYQPLIQELLDKDLAYESFMTEDELNEQREAQKARGEAPRYEYEYEGMTKKRNQKSRRTKQDVPGLEAGCQNSRSEERRLRMGRYCQRTRQFQF